MVKCGASPVSSPVKSKAIGRPSKSVFRWILVEKPPRERRMPDPFASFSTGRRDVGAQYGRVEHLDQMRRRGECGAVIEEGLEHAPPCSLLCVCGMQAVTL